MNEFIPEIATETETLPPERDDALPKTVVFDKSVPAGMGELKKMQEPARFEKARFRFRLYPLRKDF